MNALVTTFLAESLARGDLDDKNKQPVVIDGVADAPVTDANAIVIVQPN